MTKVERVLDSLKWFCVSSAWGLLAFLIAKGAGIPVWSDSDVGDAADIGVVTHLTVYLTGLRVRQWLMGNCDG